MLLDCIHRSFVYPCLKYVMYYVNTHRRLAGGWGQMFLLSKSNSLYCIFLKLGHSAAYLTHVR